ncbi:MAG: hypothetical protein AAGI37_03795 [Planctomycetota bacterium]
MKISNPKWNQFEPVAILGALLILSVVLIAISAMVLLVLQGNPELLDKVLSAFAPHSESIRSGAVLISYIAT